MPSTEAKRKRGLVPMTLATVDHGLLLLVMQLGEIDRLGDADVGIEVARREVFEQCDRLLDARIAIARYPVKDA